MTTLPATPAQLAWLSDEMPLWRAAGLVDDQTASAILGRYHPSRRFDLSRLLLTLGAAFVGVGIIWLVASNLDQLPPATRFVVVAVFWLTFLVGAEVLRGTGPSPVVGAVRTLAALTFGAVVFQAAQSLQGPAYEPALLAWWGLGALIHAYAVRGIGPLVVGLLATTSWLIGQTSDSDGSDLDVLLVLFAAGVVAASVAALHAGRLPAFAGAWRAVGAVLSLGALFTAALPYVDGDGFERSTFLVVALVVAGLAATAAVALAGGDRRYEPLIAVAIGAAGLLLVQWEADAGTWGHAALGVVVYVGAAAWFAVLGVLRDSRLLTFVATASLVLFTTVQAFSVFAPIFTGAWLFVLLGLVFVGTGWVVDRARRRLAATVEGVTR
ncbi:MAG: DUF2157 domain-containing protein [Nocardioides sp.]